MLCVIAKLDDAAAGKLTALQKAALPAGLEAKPLYGHITVATYTGDDEPHFVRSCKELLPDIQAFDVVYNKVEVLDETSIIVASPAHSEELDTVHQRITEVFDADLDRWTQSKCWYPHTTLVYGPQLDLQGICRKMAGSFAPFTAKVTGIEFSRVGANAYEIVDRIVLCNRL